MAITLVGIFDSLNDARQARQTLSRNGVDEDMVRISAADDMTTSLESHEREDHRGFFARVFGVGESDETAGHYAEAVRRGSCALTVTLEDEDRASQVTELLQQCGAIDVDARVQQWQSRGYTAYERDAPDYTADELARERDTLKVVQEELAVGKRTVDRGTVRVHRRVTETPVTEQVTLHEERAVVERRPVDRPASEAELAALGDRDQDIELRETTEEAVVSKTARVVEEVEVGKEARDFTETINDTVRRSDVDVERMEGHERDRGQLRDGQRGQQPQSPRNS